MEIRDAVALWGKPNSIAQDLIRAQLESPDAKVMSIGQAGENQVYYATVHCTMSSVGVAAGHGAVMGSKNCKAIAVRGTQGVKVANHDVFLAACLEAQQTVRQSSSYRQVSVGGLRGAETGYANARISTVGDGCGRLPLFEGKYRLLEANKQYGFKRLGCAACPIQCMENYDVPGIGGAIVSPDPFPELSAQLWRSDARGWYEALRLCQQAGIDCTSVSMIARWLMRLYELEMLTSRVAEGVPLESGGSEVIRRLIQLTVSKIGFGAVVARGARAIAEYLDARIPSEERGGKSTSHYAAWLDDLTGRGAQSDDAGASQEADIPLGVQGIVGACPCPILWEGIGLEPKHYARAMSGGLGRTVATDELLEASLKVKTLEYALRCKLDGSRNALELQRDEAVADDCCEAYGREERTSIRHKVLGELGLSDVAAGPTAWGILSGPGSRSGAGAGSAVEASVE